MNRNFNPTSPWLRSIFAAASFVATLAIAGAIEGLVTHYDAEPQMARANTVTVAQR